MHQLVSLKSLSAQIVENSRDRGLLRINSFSGVLKDREQPNEFSFELKDGKRLVFVLNEELSNLNLQRISKALTDYPNNYRPSGHIANRLVEILEKLPIKSFHIKDPENLKEIESASINPAKDDSSTVSATNTKDEINVASEVIGASETISKFKNKAGFRMISFLPMGRLVQVSSAITAVSLIWLHQKSQQNQETITTISKQEVTTNFDSPSYTLNSGNFLFDLPQSASVPLSLESSLLTQQISASLPYQSLYQQMDKEILQSRPPLKSKEELLKSVQFVELSGHVSVYGYPSDSYLDTNSKNGIGSFTSWQFHGKRKVPVGGFLQEGDVALSRDLENLVIDLGLKPFDRFVICLVDGRELDVRWSNRTAKSMSGRFDLYIPNDKRPEDQILEDYPLNEMEVVGIKIHKSTKELSINRTAGI